MDYPIADFIELIKEEAVPERNISDDNLTSSFEDEITKATLIKCPKCGKSMYDVCSQCGYPVKDTSSLATWTKSENISSSVEKQENIQREEPIQDLQEAQATPLLRNEFKMNWKKVTISFVALCLICALVWYTFLLTNEDKAKRSEDKSGIAQTSATPTPMRKVMTAEQLDKDFLKIKMSLGPDSVEMNTLLIRSMKDAKIVYYPIKDAIDAGLIDRTKVDESVNIDYSYVAVVSGYAMMLPDTPNLVNYYDQAVVSILSYDENGNYLGNKSTLCNDVNTCFIVLIQEQF